MASISDKHVLDTDVYTVLRKASLKALSALQQTFFFFPFFTLVLMTTGAKVTTCQI